LPCREHLAQLRQYDQQFLELGAKVCVVTFDAGPLAMAYLQETQLKWPLLVDNERSLYKAYGMERGTIWNIYGPASVWGYLKLLRRGRRLKLPGSDVHQLGGDVLIDPDGVVNVHHVGSGPADRPEISTLLEPMRK
jgi:hypothetical protein